MVHPHVEEISAWRPLHAKTCQLTVVMDVAWFKDGTGTQKPAWHSPAATGSCTTKTSWQGSKGTEEGYLIGLFQSNFAMRRFALKPSSATYDDRCAGSRRNDLE